MWNTLGKRIQNMGSKTLFNMRTFTSSYKVAFRWIIGLHAATLALLLAIHKGKFNEFLTKQTQIMGESPVPLYLRNSLYSFYAKRYGVDLQEVELPLKEYPTFCSFFTRKITRGAPEELPNSISSPCDGKVLTFGQVSADECHIIKGHKYSLTELFLGIQLKGSEPLHSYIRKNPQNKLYQVIIYLAPGDYHRFHAPTHMKILKEKRIQGGFEPVNEASILSGKRVYETNARKSLFSEWKQGMLGMAFVGALNVSRIHLVNKTKLNRAEQLGYFNLGSTIVILIQAKELKEWRIKEGEKIRYGEPLFEYIE